MKNDNKKILISTGGTGGHIFPSLSLAEFLKTKHKVEIVTDKRGLRYLSEYKQIKINTQRKIFEKNFFQLYKYF